MSLIPARKREARAQEFQAVLSCTVSSRTDWLTMDSSNNSNEKERVCGGPAGRIY